MLNRISSIIIARLMALAIMLMVAFHAAQPVEQPLTPQSGSAFSAATSEVAVAPPRRILPETVLLAAEPLIPPPVLSFAPVRHVASDEHVLPDSTAPPAYPAIARGPAPRAPPQA